MKSYDLGNPKGRREAILGVMATREMSLVEVCRELAVDESRTRASMRSALNALDRRGEIAVATHEDGRPVSRERSIVFKRVSEAQAARLPSARNRRPLVAAAPARRKASKKVRSAVARRASEENLLRLLRRIPAGDALKDEVAARKDVLRKWTLADYVKDRAGFKSQVWGFGTMTPAALRRLVFVLDGCVGGREDGVLDAAPEAALDAFPPLRDSVLAMPLSELLEDSEMTARKMRSLSEGALAGRTAGDFINDPKAVYDAMLAVNACGPKTANLAVATMRAKLEALARKRGSGRAARA